MGNNGFLLRNEVFLYIFNTVLILGVIVLVNPVHPREIMVILKERGKQGTLLNSKGLQQKGGVERVKK